MTKERKTKTNTKSADESNEKEQSICYEFEVRKTSTYQHVLTVHRDQSNYNGKYWSQHDTTIFERITHAKYACTNIATQQMHHRLDVSAIEN